MQYHARALAASGVDVDFVGYEGTPLPKAITDDPRITVHRIKPSTLPLRADPRRSATRSSRSSTRCDVSFRLWRQLRRPAAARPRARAESAGVSRRSRVAGSRLHRKNVRFVVDWHNLGYTVLRLRLGRWHPAVRLARWYERRDARRVDANICVSRGLAALLESRFGATTTHVLYDRPAAVFAPIERVEREQFRQALFGRLGVRLGVSGLIVCPTSWTEDEDFDLVIDAVLRLEDRIRGWEAAAPGRRFTDLVILVTGDGARRAAVRAAIRRACRRAASSCAPAGSNRRNIRASSAAPTWASASIAPRRGSTFR